MDVSAHLYVSNYFKCIQIHKRIWWGIFYKKYCPCFFTVDVDFDRLLAFEQCRGRGANPQPKMTGTCLPPDLTASSLLIGSLTNNKVNVYLYIMCHNYSYNRGKYFKKTMRKTHVQYLFKKIHL